MKVILETCLLTMEEKIRGSELAILAASVEDQHWLFNRKPRPRISPFCEELLEVAAASKHPAEFVLWQTPARCWKPVQVASAPAREFT